MHICSMASEPTEKLWGVRSRFAVATAYANSVIKDPALKAQYQAAAIGGKRAFNLAMADFLNRPASG